MSDERPRSPRPDGPTPPRARARALAPDVAPPGGRPPTRPSRPAARGANNDARTLRPSRTPTTEGAPSRLSVGAPQLPLPRSKWGMIAFALVLAGIVFLVLALLDRGSADAPGVSVRSAVTAPDGSLVQANTEGLIPLQSKDEDSYVNSIADLHTRFGEPPDATFGRLRISAADIDAPLSVRHVGDDGHMLNPSGPDDIVYYDFSGWTGLGGFPTSGGNAVFAGHVDMAAHLPYANVDYLGPGVFFKLHEIEKGDTIELDLGNGPVTYRVRWVREVAVDEGDWDSVLSSDVEVDSITLITCGGDFEGGAYTHRTVVRAERA